jgi:protein-S-isoprenylcysteine O-methyltransferase Ste14
MKELFEKIDRQGQKSLPAMDMGSLNVAARASLVNRTHRVVRERAQQMSSRRDHIRSLMVPLAVCAAMVVILVTAVWTLLDEYELTPTGIVDSSDQYIVLLLWFLPVSAILLGMVWFTRMRGGRRSGSEMAQ